MLLSCSDVDHLADNIASDVSTGLYMDTSKLLMVRSEARKTAHPVIVIYDATVIMLLTTFADNVS